MKDNRNPEDSIDAVWCWDSETGEKVLMCKKTNSLLMRLPRCCEFVEDNAPSTISLCRDCYSMTKTIRGKCGKCKEKKESYL